MASRREPLQYGPRIAAGGKHFDASRGANSASHALKHYLSKAVPSLTSYYIPPVSILFSILFSNWFSIIGYCTPKPETLTSGQYVQAPGPKGLAIWVEVWVEVGKLDRHADPQGQIWNQCQRFSISQTQIVRALPAKDPVVACSNDMGCSIGKSNTLQQTRHHSSTFGQ